MPGSSVKHQILVEIFVVVVLPVIVFGGVYFLRSDTEIDSAHDEASAEIGSVKVREALATVNKISPLEPAIFRSAEWESLVDFTPTIPEVDLGRQNPFTLPPGVRAPVVIDGGF